MIFSRSRKNKTLFILTVFFNWKKLDWTTFFMWPSNFIGWANKTRRFLEAGWTFPAKGPKHLALLSDTHSGPMMRTSMLSWLSWRKLWDISLWMLSGNLEWWRTYRVCWVWRSRSWSWFELSFSFCVRLQSDLHFSLQVANLEFLTPGLGRLTMDKSPKRKVSEENRELNYAWTDSFAFTANNAGLPVCLICGEELVNNKKCNVERHFQNKHTAFAERYQAGDERKSIVLCVIYFKVGRHMPMYFVLLQNNLVFSFVVTGKNSNKMSQFSLLSFYNFINATNYSFYIYIYIL